MDYPKKKIKCEIWKPIKEYEGFYEVSNYGNVRSAATKKKLAKCNHRGGYLLVSLQVNGNHKMKSIHRLVASAFIKNPDNLRDVNHKDGNKHNNSVENLEWVSHSQNIKHSYQVLKRRRKSNPVVCIETGDTFENLKEASKFAGVSRSAVQHAVDGITKKAGGYTWKRK